MEAKNITRWSDTKDVIHNTSAIAISHSVAATTAAILNDIYNLGYYLDGNKLFRQFFCSF